MCYGKCSAVHFITDFWVIFASLCQLQKLVCSLSVLRSFFSNLLELTPDVASDPKSVCMRQNINNSCRDFKRVTRLSCTYNSFSDQGNIDRLFNVG